MQTLDCSPGVILQTEGKTQTEVLLYVTNKQTNLIKATRSESLHPGLAWIALGLDWISFGWAGKDLGGSADSFELPKFFKKK